MKTTIVIILFLCFHNSVGQEIYTSPFSEHFPSGIVETFDRKIIVNEDSFTIETVIDESATDIQLLLIKSFELNQTDPANYRVYHCSSQDGKFPYKVVIPKDPEYILIIQPSRLIPGELEGYRLLLD